MSNRDTPQFTPAQVLDAARRAESEGRTEFAVQFYRHLSTNFPGSPEAAAAEAGLARITPMQGFPASQRIQDPLSPNGFTLPNPFQTSPGQESYDHPSGSGSAPSYYPTVASQNAVDPDAGHPHSAVELPPEPRDYRTGRFLARAATWLGGVMILAGPALAAISIANPRLAGGLPGIGSYMTSPSFGAAMAGYGIAQIVIGQLVRALFEQANATKDLAAITRANLEGRPAHQRRRSRR